MKPLNIALIGSRFMGKAHSNAWAKVAQFFDVPFKPVLKVACAVQEEPLRKFADTWGWESITTDWRDVVARDDVDIVDIAVPPYLHRDIALAAAETGKHLFCEKPVALDSGQAIEMCEAADKAGIVHYLNHNYRRCPAVTLAKQLIDEGALGRIFHWRGAYLQSWITDKNFPITWHLQKEYAGSGVHHDLNSHLVDLARYLVGEITSVTAMTTRFIEERPLPVEGTSGAFQAGSSSQSMGEVTVDDAAFVLAEFDNGALGSFESSRFAPGRKNYNCFEIYGSGGSLVFNLERMNELQYFSATDAANTQGFRTILATEELHPYVSHWWPPGHIIGYEHTFVHAIADFLTAIHNGQRIRPDFHDAVREMQVLDAALESASEGRRVQVALT